MTDAYPLAWPEGWPRSKSYERKSGKFRHNDRPINIEQATRRVFEELTKIGCKNPIDDAVISTNLKLNMRGFPRGDQGEPMDRGVAVYWQTKGKPMRVMAIDVYNTVADNLAAIAATLEAMRAIDRHGGAQILDRAFTGFTALPASGPSWHAVLGVSAHATADEIREAYRRLAPLKHPDTGGSHAAMSELNAARDEGLRLAKERA